MRSNLMEDGLAMLAPYLIGVVTAPLVARVLKPALRGVVKTSVGVALEVRRAAAEASEEIQDIAAEVNVEKVVADKADRTGRIVTR